MYVVDGAGLVSCFFWSPRPVEYYTFLTFVSLTLSENKACAGTRIDIHYLRLPTQFFSQRVPVPIGQGAINEAAAVMTKLSQLHKLALNHDVGGGMTEALDVKGQLVGFYKVSVDMSNVGGGGVSVRYTPHNHRCLKVLTVQSVPFQFSLFSFPLYQTPISLFADV